MIAVSERGDAEVTLGTAFSMLELEDDCAVAGTQPHITPEKESRASRRFGNGSEDSFPDESSLPHLAFTNTAALLDCDLSSYESPVKSSSVKDKSFLSASPTLVLLLDESATPDKVPSYCGLTLCDDGDGAPLSAINIQAQIAQFLGAPTSNVGESWQEAWAQGGGQGAVDDERCSKPSGSTSVRESGDDSEGKEELRRRLQRAFVHRIHDQKASHIVKLKSRIQPFSIGSEPCRGDAHLNQRRARSFQEHPSRMSWRRLAGASDSRFSHPFVGSSQRLGGTTQANGSSPGALLADRVFPLWNCGMNCGTLTDDELSPVVKCRKRQGGNNHNSNTPFPRQTGSDDDEDEYYDSDPEHFTPTRTLFHDDKENIPPSDGSFVHGPDHSNQPASESLVVRGIDNDDPSAQIVGEMFNDRFTLVVQEQWIARSLCDSSMETQRSRGVHAWLERGQQLRCRVVPPKLVLTEIIRESQTTSISLLDIVRIVEAELLVSDLHMMQNTLALKSHMFIIQTLDSSILVEAESQAERDRLVNGLKVVVARLGSFLLCDDDRLLDEFFLSTPDSMMMVGQEPYRYVLEADDSDDEFVTVDV